MLLKIESSGQAVFCKGFTNPCTQLYPVPSTSTQLHAAPSTSTQLILTSTQFHPPPASSFQPPRSSLQHSQQYSDQNIACNWASSPNLGRKIQNCPFCLNTGTHGISRFLILIPTLVFWICNPFKFVFWQIWAKSCFFCLKIGSHGIFWMLVLIATLVFLNSKT